MCLRRANEKKSGGEAFHCAQPKPHCKTEITDLKVGHYKGVAITDGKKSGGEPFFAVPSLNRTPRRKSPT